MQFLVEFDASEGAVELAFGDVRDAGVAAGFDGEFQEFGDESAVADVHGAGLVFRPANPEAAGHFGLEADLLVEE